MWRSFELDVPKTFVRIDRENERKIERNQTFYDRFRKLLVDVFDSTIEPGGVILYLSDNNCVTIKFIELAKVDIGSDMFSFSFKNKNTREIVIRFDSILYYEVLPNESEL